MQGWSRHDLDIKPLVGAPPFGFDCGRDHQNEYLYDCANRDQTEMVSSTYLAYVKGVHQGYLTWCMDGIRLYSHEKPEEVAYPALPALKLAQLGVNASFQGRGLGKELVALTVAKARQLTVQVGCRYVTLDSQPDLVGWYESQGFVVNKLDQGERRERAENHGRDPDTLPVSMRFDIREP